MQKMLDSDFSADEMPTFLEHTNRLEGYLQDTDYKPGSKTGAKWEGILSKAKLRLGVIHPPHLPNPTPSERMVDVEALGKNMHASFSKQTEKMVADACKAVKQAEDVASRAVAAADNAAQKAKDAAKAAATSASVSSAAAASVKEEAKLKEEKKDPIDPTGVSLSVVA